MTLDTTKPVQCGEEPARIICTDRKGRWPIVALVGQDEEAVRLFTADGKTAYAGTLDLINIDDTPPTLKIAREASALVWAEDDYLDAAKAFRNGLRDESYVVRAILKALEMEKR